MSLAPLPTDQIDPQIAAQLEAGETVLWQGAPNAKTFPNPLVVLICVALILAGLGLLLGVFDGPLQLSAEGRLAKVLIPALALCGAGGGFLFATWNNRGSRWRYAITSHRLLTVRGDRVKRAVAPAELVEVGTHSNTMYWRVTDPDAHKNRRGMEGPYVGFHGLDDPAAIKELVEDWREGFSTRASETAAQFTAAVTADDHEGPGADVTRVLHRDTGLTIDVPTGWRITVSQDEVRPWKLLGVTLAKNAIHKGPERAHGDAKPWNTLNVRGAPDAGLHMRVRQTPLVQTLETVSSDEQNERFGLKILQTTKDLAFGPYGGFSVVRSVPAGANLIGFGAVSVPVATRMVWLGGGDTSIELTGMARLDQPEVQTAIDAMVASLQRR